LHARAVLLRREVDGPGLAGGQMHIRVGGGGGQVTGGTAQRRPGRLDVGADGGHARGRQRVRRGRADRLRVCGRGGRRGGTRGAGGGGGRGPGGTGQGGPGLLGVGGDGGHARGRQRVRRGRADRLRVCGREGRRGGDGGGDGNGDGGEAEARRHGPSWRV